MSKRAITVQVSLLTGHTFDFNVQIDSDNEDLGFVGWCKVVKSDGMFISPALCVPWHTIARIERKQQIQQQIALAQVTPPDGGKPN